MSLPILRRIFRSSFGTTGVGQIEPQWPRLQARLLGVGDQRLEAGAAVLRAEAGAEIGDADRAAVVGQHHGQRNHKR